MTLSFFGKHWRTKRKKTSTESLFDAFVAAREIRPTEQFLNPDVAHLSDPELFPDMTKACERVQSAIQKQESILVFGDYDLDGISGAAIVFKALKRLGANVSVWLPARADGFGFTSKFAEEAIKRRFGLVITVDCGMSNAAQVALLKEQGIDTIITDHHSVQNDIPPAYAILHPAYPQKHPTDFVGAGVAFKFAQALLGDRLTSDFLELATLGTIADMGSLEGENRTLVALGIAALRKTENKGLKKLLALAKIAREEIDTEKIAFVIAPRLNAAGRLAHPMESLKLLLGEEDKAQILERINSDRRQKTGDFLEQISKQIDSQSSTIVLQTEAPAGIIGLLAGQLCERYNRPTVILSSESEAHLVASCRGPDDFHLADALRALSHHFLSFGGHQKAAGFSLLREKLADFTADFATLVEEKRGKEPPPPILNIDAEVMAGDLTVAEVERLNALAPFGEGHAHPVFLLKDPVIAEQRAVGKSGTHLFLRLADGHSAIGFSCGLASERKIKEIAFTPEIAEWQGKREVKIRIVDLR